MFSIVNNSHSFIRLRVSTLLLLPVTAFAGSEQLPFKNLAGSWQCAGAFADGEEITAKVVFSIDASQQMLSYLHQGTSNSNYGKYRYSAQWTYINESDLILSTGYTLSKKGNAVWLYESKEYTQHSITLYAEAFRKKLDVDNKATFTLKADGSLYHTWQFKDPKGQWQIGDYLQCHRLEL